MEGFVHFVDGSLKYIQTGEVEKYNDIWEKLSLDQDEVHFHTDLDLENRYCTEALVKGNDLDLEKVREDVKRFGESLIVAGNNNKIRIHTHTLNPETLFNRTYKEERQ